MAIQVNLLLLTIVVSVIPSLTVAVVLYLRQEAMRGDVLDARRLSEAVAADTKRLREELHLVEVAAHEADVAAHDVRLKQSAVEESFVNLANKINSRDRALAERERREAKKSELEATAGDAPPAQGDAPPLLFPPPLQPTADVPRRKFGALK